MTVAAGAGPIGAPAGAPGPLVARAVGAAAGPVGVPVGTPGPPVAVTVSTAAGRAGWELRLATDRARTVIVRRGRGARDAESTMGPQD